MMSKEKQISEALEELYRAISDIKKKYGDKVDTDFLQERFEELLKKMKDA